MRILIRKLALVVAAMLLNFPALAAGINSTAYTCPTLQALILARGYIFIGNSTFQDFVVANASLCSGGEQALVYTLPTMDQAQCPVTYCGPQRGNRTD